MSRYKRLVHIGIGEYYVSNESLIIYTLLGSCVAVCLYDTENQIGGMNHILIPGDPQMDKYDASARFGINAMELLINGIMKLGGNRKKLIAKAFGGANVIPSISEEKAMGKKNIEFVTQFLTAEKIRMVGRDFGGYDTRKIYFHTDTGEVFLKRIASPKSLARAEQKKLDQLKDRMDTPGDVTIFPPR